jgi:hypothetical protein
MATVRNDSFHNKTKPKLVAPHGQMVKKQVVNKPKKIKQTDKELKQNKNKEERKEEHRIRIGGGGRSKQNEEEEAKGGRIASLVSR